MLVRLTIVIFIIVAFAHGFAGMVERDEDPSDMYRMADPCRDWSNPHCQGVPTPR